MTEKQSLYTKYRPQTFDLVFGQNIAKNILKNSILNNKINHAYLFYGIRGTGKTTLARIFAKAINCEKKNEANPCNICDSCISITNDSSYDVIEIDAASNNGVDEIRTIKENTNYLTTNSKYKIYIIDEVHMLTKQAFNALLKTLEEPPLNTIFLLATTELQKIPQTVLSRNIIINFEVMSDEDIKEGLKHILKNEYIKYDENALDYIIMVSGGSLRDAISNLETSLLYNDYLTIENVVESLGLIKKEDILVNLKNNKIELINLIDKSNRDIQKINLLIINLLMDLIKLGDYKYSKLLNSIIDLSIKVKDPLLLKVGLKSILLSSNVPRETLEYNNAIKNEENINHIEENNFENNSKNKELNNINKNNLKYLNKIKNDNEELKIITDYADGNVYLFIIKNNDNLLMNKLIKNWKLLNNYITSDYKEEASTLINTIPLASTNKTLIIGFKNDEQIKEFKRISLSKKMMIFIKEVLGEYKFILPINSENWSQLLSIKNKVPLNKLHEIELNLDEYKYEKSDLIEQEIESLFE